MISKHGTITISKDYIFISDFTFEPNNDMENLDVVSEVLKWALDRIKTTNLNAVSFGVSLYDKEGNIVLNKEKRFLENE